MSPHAYTEDQLVEQPEQNDLLLVSQFSVVGSRSTCRPDQVGFVNGLPWVVIEL